MHARDGRRAVLVSLMLANNETGAIQPVAAVPGIAHRQGGIDAQRCRPGRRASLPLEAAARADLLTLSAHKTGGPKGAGVLIVLNAGWALPARFEGGGQERGYRAGTENVAAIAGFGAAADARRELPSRYSVRCATGWKPRPLQIAPDMQ